MFVEKPTFKQMMQAVPHLFSGKLTELDFVHTFVAKKIELSTKKYLVFESDGILKDVMGPCTIECLHEALCMTVPQYM